jgi:hypothetical protein
MLPREYTLSQYDSSPPLTACTILVIVIDSSFVEQVEEYSCLNTEQTCLFQIGKHHQNIQKPQEIRLGK